MTGVFAPDSYVWFGICLGILARLLWFGLVAPVLRAFMGPLERKLRAWMAHKTTQLELRREARHDPQEGDGHGRS